MKAILCMIALVALSTWSFGQLTLAENVPSKKVSLLSKSLSAKQKQRLGKKQLQSVGKQLHAYLSQQLSYSSVMSDNCIEGNILIQVNLSNRASILGIKVVESPHAEVSALVVDAMDKMEAIQLRHPTYYGVKKLLIPIHFSMR